MKESGVGYNSLGLSPENEDSLEATRRLVNEGSLNEIGKFQGFDKMAEFIPLEHLKEELAGLINTEEYVKRIEGSADNKKYLKDSLRNWIEKYIERMSIFLSECKIRKPGDNEAILSAICYDVFPGAATTDSHYLVAIIDEIRATILEFAFSQIDAANGVVEDGTSLDAEIVRFKDNLINPDGVKEGSQEIVNVVTEALRKKGNKFTITIEGVEYRILTDDTRFSRIVSALPETALNPENGLKRKEYLSGDKMITFRRPLKELRGATLVGYGSRLFTGGGDRLLDADNTVAATR